MHARTQETSSFFSHQLNLRFFLKKTNFSKTPERVQHLPGGGGGLNFNTGGGGGKVLGSKKLVIFLGVGSDPLTPLDPRMKTHSSDVLLMV